MNFIDNLKTKLELWTDEDAVVFLKSKSVKEAIINEHKNNLGWFFKEIDSKYVMMLFDEETINMISSSPYLINHIEGMITSNNEALVDLFSKNYYCNFISNNLNKISFFYDININAHKFFVKFLIENNMIENLEYFLKRSSPECQIAFLTDNKDNLGLYVDFLLDLSDKALEFLFNDLAYNDNIFLSKIDSIFLRTKKIKFPDSFCDTIFINNVVKALNFLEYRSVINTLSEYNDVSEIEIRRKRYVDELLADLMNYNLFKSYRDLLFRLNNKDGISYEDFDTCKDLYSIYMNLKSNDSEKNFEQFLVMDTGMITSHLILDYHFEDNTYNVMKDLKNIVDYYDNSDYDINNSQIEFYRRILNIESLSLEEKFNLHKLMKLHNQKELLYDITRHAKNHCYNKIKEEMINENNFSEYIDKEKTDELGVTVLNLKSQSFRMLIKSFGVSVDDVYDKVPDSHKNDAGSYSYIGNEKLSTFISPKENYNFVFTDFDINNILHMFNVDSYSSFSHKSFTQNNNLATDRVNELMSPTNFIKSSLHYNEVVIAQQSSSSYSNIKSNPKMSYILCYDEISENQLQSAKNMNIGIVLVDTAKYKKDVDENARGIYINVSNSNQEDIYYTYMSYNSSPICESREKFIREILSNSLEFKHI